MCREGYGILSLCVLVCLSMHFVLVAQTQLIRIPNAGYSLTGRHVLHVEQVQNRMRECSLAMGLRQQTWLSKEPVIHSVATNLTLYLNALGSIIPQHFLSSYRSPCWKSPIILSDEQQEKLRLLDQKSMKTVILGYRENIKKNLYQSIFQPSLHKGEESLMCLPAFSWLVFPKVELPLCTLFYPNMR